MITFKPTQNTYILDIPLKLADIHNYRSSLTRSEYYTIDQYLDLVKKSEVDKVINFLEINQNKGNSKYYFMIFMKGSWRKIWSQKNFIRNILHLKLINKNYYRYIKYQESGRSVIGKVNISEKKLAIKIANEFLDNTGKYRISVRDYSILRLSRIKNLL